MVRARFQKGDLFFKTMRERDVVAIHAGDEFTARRTDAIVQCLRNAAMGEAEHADAFVFFCPVIKVRGLRRIGAVV